MTLVVHRSRVAVPQAELFDFHRHVSNLARISPPFPRVRVEDPREPTEPGQLQRIRMSVGPLGRSWDARVTHVIAPRLIEDVQERGPFRRWRHQHRFADLGDGTSELTDAISFRLFPTPFGRVVDDLVVAPAIRGMLAWRHRTTRRLLEAGGEGMR